MDYIYSLTYMRKHSIGQPRPLTFGGFAYRPKSVMIEAWQLLAD